MSRSTENAMAMKTPSQTSVLAGDAWQIPLLVALVVVTWFSMTVVLHSSTPGHPDFWHAVALTIVLCAFIPLFARARFSFGYFADISFYSMIIGFFWASFFTVQEYDHVLARWSALASAAVPAAGLVPDQAAATHADVVAASDEPVDVGAARGFCWHPGGERQLRICAGRPVAIRAIARSAILNYLIGWTTGAVLPFAFAYFAWHRRYALAAAALVLI
jgi:hypothetical protein